MSECDNEPMNTMTPVHHSTMPTAGLVYAAATLAVLVVALLVLLIMARKFLRRPGAAPESGLGKAQGGYGKRVRVHDRLHAGRDRKAARAGKGACAAAHAGAGTRAGIGAAHGRSDAATCRPACCWSARPAPSARRIRRPKTRWGGGRCATARTRKFSATIPGLAQMLTACLRDGKTFQRGEVEHLTNDGEVRRLGVTISPIYRPARTAVRSASARCAPAAAGDEGERRALPDERFDRADRAAKADSLEGKSGGARRNVRGHRARIQKCAGDDLRLRADDSQRSPRRAKRAIPPSKFSTRRARSRTSSRNSCVSRSRWKSVTRRW